MNTAADVYTWTYPIQTLLKDGHEVRILARDYGCTLDILRAKGFPFTTLKPISSKYFRTLEIFTHLWEGYKISRKFDTSFVLGFGVDAALLSTILNKPSLIFTDCEPMRLQNWLNKMWASIIITPGCFLKNLGKKQIRFNSFKELAYLNPTRFVPDPSIYDELGIPPQEKYVILRFNVFDAVHDIGRKGFSGEDKLLLFREILKYAHVFISPEGPLPPELEEHRLKINPSRMHHAINYAQMVISDTGTMTTEAAVLGTPGIMCLSNVAQFGNFIELERTYNLIFTFSQPLEAIRKAVELLKQPDLKEQWAKKRQRLLADKMDFTQSIVDLMEKYPDSLTPYREIATT
jgi:uncharacterized protein